MAAKKVVKKVAVQNVPSLWTAIKERFGNFCTFDGLYKVPAGLLVIWFAYYAVQYAIAVYIGIKGAQMVYEGAYHFFTNPVKREAALQAKVIKKLRNARIVE